MEKDLITELNSDLEKFSNPDDLKRIYDKYLGKEGLIKSELKKLKGLSPEERRIKGPQIQSLQAKAQELFDKAQQDTMQKKNREDFGRTKGISRRISPESRPSSPDHSNRQNA